MPAAVATVDSYLPVADWRAGLPALAGFTDTYWMATVFLAVAVVAGVLVPARAPAPAVADRALTAAPEAG